MTDSTIQQIEILRDSAGNDFERRLFGAILACDAAAKASETAETEPGEMSRCPQCDHLWPAEDLYTYSGLCPNCVITNYYEARQRRLANRMADDDLPTRR